jgi:alkylhydroperoxidase family enzyme
MEMEIPNAANGSAQVTNLESAVLERYGNAAQEVEACLCLPVSYDKALLNVIPEEIIEKDYGCGDPSRCVHAGETVFDLGSGRDQTRLDYTLKLTVAPSTVNEADVQTLRNHGFDDRDI